jgi:cystathionine gamma-synthase
MHIETRAIHTARKPDPLTGAVAPTLVMSTTFARDENYAVPGEHVYGRTSNPNRRALEEAYAALEGGAAAIAYASGQAASNALFQCLNPGEHVVLPREIYFGTRALFDAHFARMGIEMTPVGGADVDELRAALRPNTRLVWVETPSNPLLQLTDIAAAAQAAHDVGARCVVDNTWATPFCQQPLALGADVALHSTSKYFGGHSDVTGGALVFRQADEFYTRAPSVQALGGAVPSPFDCWLIQRSIPSMAYRMRAHTENAAQVAQFLAAHPAVSAVHYPGLPSHPQHAVARAQMQSFGGMLSFEAAGGREAALRVAARVQLFKRATSLGGYESLIEHRASVEGPTSTAPAGLLRCSIGLEHPADLIDDLRTALDSNA